jgi:hypothetical protein
MRDIAADVLELVLEFAYDLRGLLLARTVSSAWADAATSCADWSSRSAVRLARSPPHWYVWPKNRAQAPPRISPRVLPGVDEANPSLSPEFIARAVFVLIGPRTLYLEVFSSTLRMFRARAQGQPALGGLQELRVCAAGMCSSGLVADLAGLEQLAPKLQTLTIFGEISCAFPRAVLPGLQSLTSLRLSLPKLQGFADLRELFSALPPTLLTLHLSCPVPPSLSLGTLDNLAAGLKLEHLDLANVRNSIALFREFPLSIETLKVSHVPTPEGGVGKLPDGLKTLYVCGQVTAGMLRPVRSLTSLECDGFPDVVTNDDLKEFTRVAAGLRELVWGGRYEASGPFEADAAVLSALGPQLKALSLVFVRRVMPAVALACPSLETLELCRAGALSHLGDAFCHSLRRLRLCGAAAQSSLLSRFPNLTEVVTLPVEDSWSDSDVSALAAGSSRLERLVLRWQGRVTRLPCAAGWHSSLTDLDVSGTAFDDWASLGGFTALKHLRASGVRASWCTLPEAFGAFSSLESLALSTINDDENVPSDIVAGLALATRQLRQLELRPTKFICRSTLRNCFRTDWTRLVRLEVVGVNCDDLYEVLVPRGAWECAVGGGRYWLRSTKWSMRSSSS